MAKNTIEWHKECLANCEEHHRKLREERKRVEDAEYQARIELERYRAQIKRAELMGKDGFDRDKFLSFSNPRHR
jgi:hypothetical protein